MSWPVSQDYNEAVQDPAASFADPELRAAEPVTNALGLPVPCSGNFADVYQLRHPATGASWAVKCFTRLVLGRQERYDEISRHLGRARLPFTVDFTYLIDGIRVRGQWFPVVKMQWVEGLLLNQFVRESLNRPRTLEKLINLWARMARRLREAGVAHGDLQHGNVLLVPGSRTTKMAVKLIDYDGMFVPALAARPTDEVGHPAYQHPRRPREGAYGPEVDRVPLLVVATALRGLAAAGPRLWKRYDTGDNLLFREADLRAPAESELFHELWRLPDPLAHVLVARLALACRDPLDGAPLLSELLADDLLPVLSAEQQERAEAILGNDGGQVAVPADHDEPAEEPARPVPSGLVIVWAGVGLLVLALAVALPIVWFLAAPTPGPRKGAATSQRAKPPGETAAESGDRDGPSP